jgi:putative spermidine/putrescine transport system ATP-binding protein
MSDVVFASVSKRFGSTQALHEFDLALRAGELVCLLGPSGCGKTTALRILAGFETPDTGDVLVAGRSVLDVDARRRNLGIVFQSYSLFPNMTARRNIGFALQLKGVRGAAQRSRIDDLLSLTRLTEHADKYPHQLSGGQQQRVALARAIAVEPPVLLLDEPLSALDAAVREQLRVEIRRLQTDLGITTLFVTHDQHEAMALADRIGVMSAGQLVQVGPPATVYANPASAFVSSFLGTSNRLPVVDGKVLATPVSAAAPSVDVRPEHIGVVQHGGSPATVRSVSFLGALTRLDCTLGKGEKVIVDLPSHAASEIDAGDDVLLALNGPISVVE